MCGAPGEIRTPDRSVRSRVLYPAELRAHNLKPAIITNNPIRITYINRYSIYSRSNRRGARVVDWGSLLRSCTGDCTEGSNPSLSAIKRKGLLLKDLSFLLTGLGENTRRFDKIAWSNFEHRHRRWPEGQNTGKYFCNPE